MRKRSAGESVGYRKPPKRSRFRSGKSGNPKGRPQGSKNLEKILAAALQDRVTVTINGRRKTITKFEASLKQLMNQAASGDIKAIQTVLKQAVNGAQGDSQNVSLDALDTKENHLVMADIVRRIRLQNEPISGPDEAEGGKSARNLNPKRKKRP